MMEVGVELSQVVLHPQKISDLPFTMIDDLRLLVSQEVFVGWVEGMCRSIKESDYYHQTLILLINEFSESQ